MNLPMVDCRSLIEFCKAFEQQKNSLAMSDQRSNHSHSRNKKHSKSLNSLSHPFCDHSPFAAIDILVFLLVLGALGVLTVPYFKFLFDEACEVFPEAFVLIGEVIYTAPFAYAIGLVVMFVSVILAWEVIHHKSRKCGNPYCKGLRKAVEFDIQLESEECVKYMPPLPAYRVRPLELGEDHKELEAELKRMAPLNGRTVLIFRAPCGCPAGRMEVWGPKKIRRIKKTYTYRELIPTDVILDHGCNCAVTRMMGSNINCNDSRMASNHHASYALGNTGVAMAGTKGHDPAGYLKSFPVGPYMCSSYFILRHAN